MVQAGDWPCRKGPGVPVDERTLRQQRVRAAKQVNGVPGCAGKRCQQVEERGCSLRLGTGETCLCSPYTTDGWLVTDRDGAEGLEALCVRWG